MSINKELYRRLVRLANPGRLLCASCFEHRVAVYRLVVDQQDRGGWNVRIILTFRDQAVLLSNVR